MARQKLTVVLLKPDYVAEQFGDTSLIYTEAIDIQSGLKAAQQEAADQEQDRLADDTAINPEDFTVLFAAPTYVADVKNES